MSGDFPMTVHTSAEVARDLDRLLGVAATAHEPILIKGEQASGVLVSEEDWRAMQETLYLLSIPGMRESIEEASSTPLSDCSDQVEW